MASNSMYATDTKTQKGGPVRVISNEQVEQTVGELVKMHGSKCEPRIKRGVARVAMLWNADNGSEKEFNDFCIKSFICDDKELETVFEKASFYFEALRGGFNQMSLELNWMLQLDLGEIHPIDLMFGSYDPSANYREDFFKNRIAFYLALNFPYYTLKEKETLGKTWTRKQWAYARLGDIFASRVPAELLLKQNEVRTIADSYISEYNIYAGHLVDDKGKTYFPTDMKLISHWNLRDELKSHYTNKPDELFKQKMIYQVMLRIISQEIPQCVINSGKFNWNPFTNKVYDNGKEIKAEPEPNTRYQTLLKNFLVELPIDNYTPDYPTYIERKFSAEMEIPVDDVEALFIDLCSSPVIRKVGNLIKKRLGRNLEPFDIWYDGFKARSSMNLDELDKKVRAKYPDIKTYAADIPRILRHIGFTPQDADRISSLIAVDPSRGAGHAAGASKKSEKAHLRTRFSKDGMNYKGYNIATHELGHNVEQTITLQDVDYYTLSGVPNTAFTEAWAFIFQSRDLDLLGIKSNNPDEEALNALDNLWSAYEIMGVSLVDINVWKWLYNNPDANSEELKKAVISIAKEIWNKYYADVFGVRDQPILAIYSHMIDYPLYLSAYPIGHLIEFQIEEHAKGKNLASEMKRMLEQGCIVPQIWMQGAVGSKLSNEPLLKAADKACDKLNMK
jgi:hypothetical protein